MIELGAVALGASAVAVGVALVALEQVRRVRDRMVDVLDESAKLRDQVNLAQGQAEGAAQERAIAAQARMDRATAAALVLNPEPPAPTGPLEVTIMDQSKPVVVQITDAQAITIADKVADRAAEAADKQE